MKILLLGPPASGKGTIGRMLGEHFNIPVLSVGKFLRSIPEDSKHYKQVQEIMSRGDLVPNDILGKMLSDMINDYRYENGFIVEGWGRQVSDLKYFDPEPDVVLLLEVQKEVSWDRISNRRVCEVHGHTYNLNFDPPQNEGVCDIDGSKLVKRGDDNRKTFEKRWEVHETSTVESIEHYSNQGKLIRLDASKKPQEIFNKAIEEIEQRLKL